MSIHGACHVLVVVLSISCTFGAEECPGGVCDYQSSELLQRAQSSEAAQLVDTDGEEDGKRSSYQRRATTLIETDLSKYSHSHYKEYDPKKSADENIREAFEHFLAVTGLDKELDEEEKGIFWTHFKEDIALRLKHEHDHHDAIADLEKEDREKFSPKDWRADVAKALQEEKPMLTKKLVELINAGNFGFKVKYDKWSGQLAKRQWDSMMGLKRPTGAASSGSDAVLLQTKGLAIPASFESAQQWPSCSGVILRAHNQGICGSCWAFGALSALDSRLCINSNASWSGPRAMLSRGQVTSCTYPDRDGCQGGWPSVAYEQIFKYGQGGGGGVTGGTEGCSPYFGHGEGTEHFQQTQSAPPCPTMCASSYKLRGMDDDRFRFPSMQIQNLNRERNTNMLTLAKESMMTGGPLAFALQSNNVAFMGYSDGIIDAADCSASPDHASTAVGWGTYVDDKGTTKGYLSAMNSWGDDWGDRGGFKIIDCAATDFILVDFSVGKEAPDPLVAQEGPTPVPTRGPPTPAPTEGDHPWEVTFGPCTRDSAGCIMSGNYPQAYSNNEDCQFKIYWQVQIEVVDFNTEVSSDWFGVGNSLCSGSCRSIHGKTADRLSWQSDKSGTSSGWKLCPGASSGGADGPVPAPAPDAAGVCTHANVMPLRAPYYVGFKAENEPWYTQAQCVTKCRHAGPDTSCKAFMWQANLAATARGNCYFLTDYIESVAGDHPGWITVQVKDCPAASPGPAPGPASTAAPTANPTTSPTDMPTGRPTPMPTVSPTPLPTSVPTPRPTASTTSTTSIATTVPPASAQQIVSSCSFEKDNGCGIWTNSQSDQFDWTRRSGPTPSSSTGPQKAGDGSYYMYIEASHPRQNGDMAVLEAKGLSLSGPGELKFMYSMFGQHIGTLNVTVNGNNVFTRSGNQNDASWSNAACSLPAGELDVRFEGVRGASWKGDIAIDNIILELVGDSNE